jgi:uncharacterized tellurite resistance protein B-like protein
MLDKIRGLFDQYLQDAGAGDVGARAHAHQLASAALLFEVARADFDISASERDLIHQVVQHQFQLSDEETGQLLSLAEEETEQATCLFGFTSVVNEQFSVEEKISVMEMLWRVALADERIEKHEQHLMRKLASLLHIPHKEYVAAKFRAREAAARE